MRPACLPSGKRGADFSPARGADRGHGHMAALAAIGSLAGNAFRALPERITALAAQRFLLSSVIRAVKIKSLVALTSLAVVAPH